MVVERRFICLIMSAVNGTAVKWLTDMAVSLIAGHDNAHQMQLCEGKCIQKIETLKGKV